MHLKILGLKSCFYDKFKSTLFLEGGGGEGRKAKRNVFRLCACGHTSDTKFIPLYMCFQNYNYYYVQSSFYALDVFALHVMFMDVEWHVTLQNSTRTHLPPSEAFVRRHDEIFYFYGVFAFQAGDSNSGSISTVSKSSPRSSCSSSSTASTTNIPRSSTNKIVGQPHKSVKDADIDSSVEFGKRGTKAATTNNPLENMSHFGMRALNFTHDIVENASCSSTSSIASGIPGTEGAGNNQGIPGMGPQCVRPRSLSLPFQYLPATVSAGPDVHAPEKPVNEQQPSENRSLSMSSSDTITDELISRPRSKSSPSVALT